MGEYYGFDFSSPEISMDMIDGAIGFIIGLVVLILLVAVTMAIVSYVLTSVAMYRIAKRRGIHHPWLAWLPVGNSWMLGSISDQYQYVAKHNVTNRRKILVIFSIVTLAICGIYAALRAAAEKALFLDASVGGGVVLIVLSTLVLFLLISVCIAYSVFAYLAYFDLFRSCKPKNAVLFLVLGAVFTVTLPFFLIACSNKDEGMPPKRVPQTPVQIPAEPDETPVAEDAPAEDPPVAEEPAAPEEIPVVEGEIVEDPQ